jgi:hypothetical protein
MKRSVMLLGLVAIAFSARPAQAQQTILQVCLAGCDASYPDSSWDSISMRGWCYLLNC